MVCRIMLVFWALSSEGFPRMAVALLSMAVLGTMEESWWFAAGPPQSPMIERIRALICCIEYMVYGKYMHMVHGIWEFPKSGPRS